MTEAGAGSGGAETHETLLVEFSAKGQTSAIAESVPCSYLEYWESAWQRALEEWHGTFAP